MKAYGYKINCEKIEELKDITIKCNTKELDKIIEFFEYVKETNEEFSKIAQVGNATYEQYRDWDPKWKKPSPDIVLAVHF